MKNKNFVFIGIGFELVVLVLAGTAISESLEKKFNSKGLITMAVFFVIIVGWFVHIYSLLKGDDDN